MSFDLNTLTDENITQLTNRIVVQLGNNEAMINYIASLVAHQTALMFYKSATSHREDNSKVRYIPMHDDLGIGYRVTLVGETTTVHHRKDGEWVILSAEDVPDISAKVDYEKVIELLRHIALLSGVRDGETVFLVDSVDAKRAIEEKSNKLNVTTNADVFDTNEEVAE